MIRHVEITCEQEKKQQGRAVGIFYLKGEIGKMLLFVLWGLVQGHSAECPPRIPNPFLSSYLSGALTSSLRGEGSLHPLPAGQERRDTVELVPGLAAGTVLLERKVLFLASVEPFMFPLESLSTW